MAKEWKYPGSRWWRFDFHAHTPGSDDYGRGDNIIKTSTTPEVLLQSCMEAKLDCVVIADHNSGDWIDKLKIEYEQLSTSKPGWFRSLVFFPGVEITVSTAIGRVHLLGVFDCDQANRDTIIAVLSQCGITGGYGSPDSSTTTSFEETIKKIKNLGGIAIAAHIDGKQGLLDGVTALNPELQRSLKQLSFAEFCNLNAFSTAAPELQKEVARLAKVAGSDAHRPDEIGRHGTWVKMSRPSIEGLRLALLDHDLCVDNHIEDPNREPDFFIQALEISTMHHCGKIVGKPFEIKFHPLFNAIIGGRGTGKSTVLNSLRIAARREDELSERLRADKLHALDWMAKVVYWPNFPIGKRKRFQQSVCRN